MILPPLEQRLSDCCPALVVLIFFYGVYFSKMLMQKRQGIKTHQIGRRKEKQFHRVESLMGIATLVLPAVQILEPPSGKRPFYGILYRNAGRCYIPYRGC